MDGISGPFTMFCDRAWFECMNRVFSGKIMLAGYFFEIIPSRPPLKSQIVYLFVCQ